MADVKNIVTLGIGAAPGGLVWFFTGGLESGVEVIGPSIVMTVPYHSHTMSVLTGSHTISVPVQSRTMSVPRTIGMEPE
jgi:hypothetical protein